MSFMEVTPLRVHAKKSPCGFQRALQHGTAANTPGFMSKACMQL